MTVSQDVLVQFDPNNVMVGIAGYYVAPEGTQHVIVGFRDGTLTEVYWKTGQGVHQDTLGNFANGVVGVGGYYNSKDGSQHAIYGTSSDELYEVYWKSGQGIHQDKLTQFSS